MRTVGTMGVIKRHDPFGGAYGAALGASAGDFMFASVSGVRRCEMVSQCSPIRSTSS